MSGSKKGAPRRPYRTAPKPRGYFHVLLRTPEEAASDAWENAPTTADLLSRSILPEKPE